MLKNKLALRILFNTLLGLVLIFIWSRFVNFEEILENLRHIQVPFALLFFVFFATSGAVRGMRLKTLLQNNKLTVKDAVMLTYLGQLLSFLVPVRAGEISKSVYLTSQLNVPLSKAVTWVFVDRLLDFLLVTVFITVLIAYIPANLPPGFPLIILALLLGFCTVILMAVTSGRLLKRLFTLTSNLLVVSSVKRWFVSFTHNIVEGLEILRRHPLDFAKLILLTMLAFASDAMIWVVTFQALGIDFGFFRSLLANSLYALTFLIPSAPGYVGSAEAAGLAVFSGALGVEANRAAATVVLFHVLTIVALIFAGVSSLYFLKFDLGLVWKKIRGQ